ncbi:MAG: acyl-CoA synthetase FdrA [Xanthobacteraceae bacterium]|nr:acyl-CoA synthetase FdrA [Xanthobacteraceae bacterium]
MTTLVNRVRRTFYMDSVALMRISRTISSQPGVQTAALMIGSATNKKLMQGAGLLNNDGDSAGANDLVLAVRADDEKSALDAIKEAETLLDAPTTSGGDGDEWHPKTIDTALQQLPGVNVALISVPGEFAAAEARRALDRGLHVMMFSDNVPVEDEVALKQEAKRRGLLMMGPDCGTAIIGGVPLAFANVIARGDVGIVGASGTGLQEVSTLLARNGKGVSHAIGVGGRDLKQAVGGITTLMAIDALDRDPGTQQIVLISKPPEPSVAKTILDRVGQSKKKFAICFIGAEDMSVPANATLSSELRSTAESALGGKKIAWAGSAPRAADIAKTAKGGRKRVKGLFSGGTLCAEAQVFFRKAGVPVASNVPIPGVGKPSGSDKHVLLDLGDDEYTVGRPHPMIDPTLRNQMFGEAMKDGETAIILFDVVIGYGANSDPAGDLVAQLPAANARDVILIASVCGTEQDPQGYSRQVQLLKDAGVIVAPSNAHAAELAIEVLGKIS